MRKVKKVSFRVRLEMFCISKNFLGQEPQKFKLKNSREIKIIQKTF